MLAARTAAVRDKAAGHYTQDIIDEWTPLDITPDRITQMDEQIANPESCVVVAEAGTDILGFGVIEPSGNYLRAIYARKNKWGGVGQRILDALLVHARERKVAWLGTDSSLNAEAFYEKNGFRSLGRTQHTTNSGVNSIVVKMRIDL